jgi:PAS domain-containing protein
LALFLSIGVLLVATLALPFGRLSPNAGSNIGPEVWGFHLSLILIFGGAWLLLRIGFGYVEQNVADHTAKLTHARQQLKQEILARQQSEQRLYTLAQSTHDLLCIWDGAGQKWSYCNHPETLRQRGWELPSYANLLHHIHPDDQARVREGRTTRSATFPHAPLEYRLCLNRDTLN